MLKTVDMIAGILYQTCRWTPYELRSWATTCHGVYSGSHWKASIRGIAAPLFEIYIFAVHIAHFHRLLALLQGLQLELFTDDHFGLLSDITRILRENGLCPKRAKISTKNGKARHNFIVTDVSGNPVEPKTIYLIRQQMGQTVIQVKGNLSMSPKFPQETPRSFLFGSFFKCPSFQNSRLIKSLSWYAFADIAKSTEQVVPWRTPFQWDHKS
jgi:hypothetical protein